MCTGISRQITTASSGVKVNIRKVNMKFIDFFSGIGGFHIGLEKVGMECIGWCEFDKNAQASYRAMYDTDNLWFGDDVTKVRGKDLPKADLWTFGFPCQDISIAGNQKGLKKGTRSGLFYEIMRLLDECKENKPKWLMCENVKNLLSIDGGGGSQGMRVYDPEGTSCTLSAQGGGMGAKTGLYTVTERGIHNLGNVTAYENKNTVWSTGISRTLTATDYKHVPKVAIKNATKQGYQMAEVGDGIDLAYPESETRRGRVQPQRSNTLTTSDNLGVLVNGEPIRIRKLTPKECWRLQGFSDEQYEKAAAVNSNSQLYKQAGNAVTVNVVEEIGRHIMEIINE